MTPIDLLEIPFSANILLVRNMTLVPMLQITLVGKLVPYLKILENSVPEILSPFSKSIALYVIALAWGIPESTV